MVSRHMVAATALAAVCLSGHSPAALAQAAAPQQPPIPAGAVVRRVVMTDSLCAEQFRTRLEAVQAQGLFRLPVPGDPKQPHYAGLSFVSSGNYVLVVGDPDWVDSEIEGIRLMAFMFERPRAHLQMNLRVVQLTGPANNDVIQMTDTVRALVDTQRTEIARSFADMQDYLQARLRRRTGKDLAIYEEVRKVLPTFGREDRPLTIPEILLLLMIDRSLPALPPGPGDTARGRAAEDALEALPRKIGQALQDPLTVDVETARQIGADLVAWRKAAGAALEWCRYYADQLQRKDAVAIGAFQDALQRQDCPLPPWIALRLLRSLHLTERLYAHLAYRQTASTLRELERRFRTALEREAQIDADLARYLATVDSSEDTGKGDKRGPKKPAVAFRPGYVGRQLMAVKDLAGQLVSAPLAVVDSIYSATDDSAPSAEQIVSMFRQYAEQRNLVDQRLDSVGRPAGTVVNYARLQAVEAGLNLWLRRASEAMLRTLEQQFYNRYAEELRLLANKELIQSSSRDVLSRSEIGDVPDVARDLLLADTGVNLFVSNSASLQFAPDTTNTVTAQVQAQLPSKAPLLERVQQAGQANGILQSMPTSLGIPSQAIVDAILAGGEAVPVRAGIMLRAKPSIGIDDSVVTLTLTANQTLQPESDRITDRVTQHNIDNATVTVLSYEPMVLSTLTSNITYYENSGGVPVLRKVPGVKDLLGDIPISPFRVGKRAKGVYQSSVIILEPVVIPTIEDLVRYSAGWKS